MLPLTTVLGFSAEKINRSSADKAVGIPKHRNLSQHLSTVIRDSLPQYTPPPSAAKATDEFDTANIVFLKPITVTGQRQPNATPWAMLSELGRTEYLKKRYPGATVPGAALTESTPNYATQMHRDEVRLQDLEELNDAGNLSQLNGDPELNQKLRQELRRVRLRRYDWRVESLDKSFNNNRR